jgi:hypothetical protein
MAKKSRKAKVERNPHFDSNADLRRKANDLIEIVEGVSSVGWAYGAKRLKDTHEWCAFYVSAKRL